MSRRSLTYLLVALFLGLVISVGLVAEWDTEQLRSLIASHPYAAPVLYVLLLAASVVIAPFVSLPLVPFAVMTWGVFLTGILSATGWWVGAIIAFLISRYAGRPVLRLFMSLERIDAWTAQFSGRTTFTAIVLLRLTTPVEIASYALGFVRSVSFTVYAAASLVGIIPFSFLWAYAGGELLERDWIAVFAVLGVAAVVLLGVWDLRKQRGGRGN